ncbi:hypothetical protein BFW38_04200 [Terasakiispira papahanaumokuakeensis]|uniref:N-acetyltransferase domain-containing protein n=1 Tax=Terasakiispira papahanaumokuakeensis TaxID=197479 RepID=A0A1E2V7P2_9GAMM|nr:GNAT family N-acetyltransferase [Terasakiispira papahanaumokuakeensis]ODC02872.1 hypothetical protein BFW38_04200 [Terasakiispira papahanaumokuakeensis]
MTALTACIPAVMTRRHATEADLPRIVEIYNAAIPGRLATADTAPVTLADRLPWFERHQPDRRPLWVLESDQPTSTEGASSIVGWLSFEDFYGRPAYSITSELSIYVAPEAQGQGVGRRLLEAALAEAPGLGLEKLVAYIFSHNHPSLSLFRRYGFETWGSLPEVAVLDDQSVGLSILGLTLPAVSTDDDSRP